MNAWPSASKVLCVRLDSLGDLLMTTPAFHALKQTGIERLSLLTSPAGAKLAPLLPDVDDTIVYEAPWMKASASRVSTEEETKLIERLKEERFDAAVVFTVYSQNPLPAALTCYLAGIPLRLAYCRENPYQLLTDWVRETEPESGLRHEVRRHLDLVSSIGAQAPDDRLRLAIPPQARENVQRLLISRGIRLDQRWVLVHPGATAASRRYPPESFAVVVRDLVQKLNCQVVITGDESERALATEIQTRAGVPVLKLTGQLDLAHMAAIVGLAPLLITNNTGPAHIAAATGTPVVVLYALTNPQHTPWKVQQRVLFYDVPCRFCYKSVCPQGHGDCLRRVPPSDVVDAAAELLIYEEVPSHPRPTPLALLNI